MKAVSKWRGFVLENRQIESIVELMRFIELLEFPCEDKFVRASLNLQVCVRRVLAYNCDNIFNRSM